MANHMKEVAKMLGVELNEEFEIEYEKGNTAIAKMTQHGLCIISTSMVFYGNINRATLYWLLIGKCHIKHKPWKPNKDESYWFTNGRGTNCYCWHGDISDWNAYKLGNCYRTQEEAQADCDKWLAFYDSDEQLTI